MILLYVAIYSVDNIGGAFVIAVIAHWHPRKINTRSGRPRIPLAPRIGEDGGSGLNGRNGKQIFALSFACWILTEYCFFSLAFYGTRNVRVLRFLAWGRTYFAGLGVLTDAIRNCFLVLAMYDRRNVLRCASSLVAAIAIRALAF